MLCKYEHIYANCFCLCHCTQVPLEWDDLGTFIERDACETLIRDSWLRTICLLTIEVEERWTNSRSRIWLIREEHGLRESHSVWQTVSSHLILCFWLHLQWMAALRFQPLLRVPAPLPAVMSQQGRAGEQGRGR